MSMTTEWAIDLRPGTNYTSASLATALSDALGQDWVIADLDAENRELGLLQVESKNLDYQALSNGKVLCFSSTIDWARFFGFPKRREKMLKDFRRAAKKLGSGKFFVYPDYVCVLGLLWDEDAKSISLESVKNLLKQTLGEARPRYADVNEMFEKGKLDTRDFYFDQDTE